MSDLHALAHEDGLNSSGVDLMVKPPGFEGIRITLDDGPDDDEDA